MKESGVLSNIWSKYKLQKAEVISCLCCFFTVLLLYLLEITFTLESLYFRAVSEQELPLWVWKT